jgi:tRNA A-37 threonylcarbamoyl transferase component Bud32
MSEQTAPDARLGQAFAGRYRLSARLAEGGMAELYVARQKAMAGFEKDIVIKVLKQRFHGDPRVVEMFLEEARIGAALNHSNIVHVYDVDEEQGVPFIAMEYIRGEELAALCKRSLALGEFLPFDHAVDLVRQAAEGMGYFHAARDEQGAELGIVHRDISPSNLMITVDGNLKIIDFGIAKLAEAQNTGLTTTGAMLGTPDYMAPEQIEGTEVTAATDIYALGIVLYEVSVGRRLFRGPADEVRQLVAKGEIKPPTFVRRDFPVALESIVMRALEKHPADRYQNAYELASDLEGFMRSEGLESGAFRIAQYLDGLAKRAGETQRPELAIAGDAWVDDEGEEALDFGRTFKDVKRARPVALERPVKVPPRPSTPPPLPDPAPPAPPPAPAVAEPAMPLAAGLSAVPAPARLPWLVLGAIAGSVLAVVIMYFLK